MGQYFRAVNVTKREYVSAWNCGGGAKLWEWCADTTAGIFPYLLRKSSGRGGGDIRRNDAVYAGRWAGDEIYLIGDYDEGDLYTRAEREFANIAPGLIWEYNEFIEVKELMLEDLTER